MDKWDEEKLKEVVKKKQNKPKTDIVSNAILLHVHFCPLIQNSIVPVGKKEAK